MISYSDGTFSHPLTNKNAKLHLKVFLELIFFFPNPMVWLLVLY
jgi:hypothetical protein